MSFDNPSRPFRNKIEKLLNVTKESDEASKEIYQQLLRRQNAKRYQRAHFGGAHAKQLRMIAKSQIHNGLQNVKEKPFGLYDLKTGDLLMKKDMTAFSASKLNMQLEPMGMHWKNIPY